MTKTENPFPAEKIYKTGEKQYVLRPLSTWDALDLMDAIVKMFSTLPGNGINATPADIASAGKSLFRCYLAMCLGIAEDEFRSIPADVGAAMVADFMEVNLTENFLSNLARIARAGSQIVQGITSRLSKS